MIARALGEVHASRNAPFLAGQSLGCQRGSTGTQRPGVTIALHVLERGGLISTRCGAITILDRKALEESSNGTYLAPQC